MWINLTARGFQVKWKRRKRASPWPEVHNELGRSNLIINVTSIPVLSEITPIREIVCTGCATNTHTAKLILGQLLRHLHGRLSRWIKWTACDVAEIILQPFRHFIYVTTHSPTLPLLHLRHSSFSNPSFASSMSQVLHLIHLASRPWSFMFRYLFLSRFSLSFLTGTYNVVYLRTIAK